MNLKHQLYKLCVSYIAKKVDEITTIIEDAVESANNESKSSAGDKYETGREMMEQEIELNTERLKELIKQREIVEKINPDQKQAIIQLGSLVKTNFGFYYLSIAAGQLKIGGVTYFAISTSSPAGVQLMGKKAGDSFSLNTKNFIIEEVC